MSMEHRLTKIIYVNDELDTIYFYKELQCNKKSLKKIKIYAITLNISSLNFAIRKF